MQLKKLSLKFSKQRKFFVLLLILLPLTALLLWALTGVKESNKNDEQSTQKGLNTALPDAHLKEDKPLDKMSYYDKAALDSAKRKELMKNDPYYHQQETAFSDESGNAEIAFPTAKLNKSTNMPNPSAYGHHISADPNEAKVYSKLEQLNVALNKAAAVPEAKPDNHPVYPLTNDVSGNRSDVDRLEKMMHTMQQKDGDDPEMQQMNGMLDKIMNIQHPELVQEKIRQTSEERKGQVFAVSAKEENDPVSSIDNEKGNKKGFGNDIHFTSQTNYFYSIDDAPDSNTLQNAIEAVVNETQTLVNNSVVKLRLVNDVYINGVLILKDNFVFGTASLDGERLTIKINSIRYKNSLFPVALSVYDLDGMEGIYIPGAINRDVAKQSADRAMQNFGIASLDPSIGAQAASAGIEAAKTLASKKVKLVKVTVKAGYQVLLHDEKQKENS